jgi:hypothetical protein
VTSVPEVFNQHDFATELRCVKDEYSIKPAVRNDRRSSKRVTILVSTAYLKCGGSVHWSQEIEAHLMREMKNNPLSCDPLEMEGVDRSYTKHGKRNTATQFDNHIVNERSWVSETLPIVKAILKILKEEVKEYVRSEFQKHHLRRGVEEAVEDQQGATGEYEKERVTLHRAFEGSQDIPRRQCYEVVE